MKNNKYQFLYYESKHFEQLLKLSKKFRYEHNNELPPENKLEREKIEKAERKYLKSNSSSKYYRYYICAKGNKLIGHIWFGQQDNDRSKGFIDQLYVKPKYRKKGIAISLFKEAIRWLGDKNCSTIDLDVKIDNQGAIRLYQKMGLKEQEPKWITFSMNLND